MKPKFIMKEVHISSKTAEVGCLEFAVNEGDVILDKNFSFKVLPAAMDFTKPISRNKVSKSPVRESERLLRIKNLGEDSALIAILHQESYIEGSDTIIIKENEQLVAVNYGEKFYVYAKQQMRDMPGAITYSFIITNTSKPQEQKVQDFCTECGTKLMNGDNFCRECGTPVGK